MNPGDVSFKLSTEAEFGRINPLQIIEDEVICCPQMKFGDTVASRPTMTESTCFYRLQSNKECRLHCTEVAHLRAKLKLPPAIPKKKQKKTGKMATCKCGYNYYQIDNRQICKLCEVNEKISQETSPKILNALRIEKNNVIRNRRRIERARQKRETKRKDAISEDYQEAN